MKKKVFAFLFMAISTTAIIIPFGNQSKAAEGTDPSKWCMIKNGTLDCLCYTPTHRYCLGTTGCNGNGSADCQWVPM